MTRSTPVLKLCHIIDLANPKDSVRQAGYALLRVFRRKVSVFNSTL